MATIPNTIAGLQVIQSAFAVHQEGTEDKVIQVKRTWWERFFDPDPTRPLWQKTRPKIIQVPHYEPVMYRMMDKLIVHTSLMPKLIEAMEQANKSSNVFRWDE